LHTHHAFSPASHPSPAAALLNESPSPVEIWLVNTLKKPLVLNDAALAADVLACLIQKVHSPPFAYFCFIPPLSRVILLQTSPAATAYHVTQLLLARSPHDVFIAKPCLLIAVLSSQLHLHRCVLHGAALALIAASSATEFRYPLSL
jgi:hypothetical protein